MHLHYHIPCIVSSFCTVFSPFPSFLYFSLTFFVHYLYYSLLFPCILCILFLRCIVCNSCILCYTISKAYKYNIKGVYYEMYHSKYCWSSGASRNTVSKALKNSSEVSENTRNLVIKTASKLGYKNATFATPVIPASETGSNGTILFLTRTYASDSEFWTTVLRGIESILSNANYHLAISIMSDSDLKQLNFPQTISDSSIKGIILVEICDKVVCDALSQFNLPIVSVDMPNVRLKNKWNRCKSQWKVKRI